ncbi:hypothetical protein [Curtobacterium sp. MCBD17_040]|uniref:zinc finger domain-containing protein n=1 Tax=Curtobacterium sp. MCBD17_040 TaxID=2175674 RepID=UPI0011B5B56F|nr:hypothetical protein [Curtobacterium sp. MCBD17_040]WIB65868.1 hypothetical protein DEI94_17285 [Curtobacterium sp. MCBD17_040]
MTTSLTVVCPECGARQGKACRTASGASSAPHSLRRDRLADVRQVSDAVYFLPYGDPRLDLPAGDLIVGRRYVPDPTLVVGIRRLTDGQPLNHRILTRAYWVGWEPDFNPDLFDPAEALEAFT